MFFLTYAIYRRFNKLINNNIGAQQNWPISIHFILEIELEFWLKKSLEFMHFNISTQVWDRNLMKFIIFIFIESNRNIGY